MGALAGADTETVLGLFFSLVITDNEETFVLDIFTDNDMVHPSDSPNVASKLYEELSPVGDSLDALYDTHDVPKFPSFPFFYPEEKAFGLAWLSSAGHKYRWVPIDRCTLLVHRVHQEMGHSLVGR